LLPAGEAKRNVVGLASNGVSETELLARVGPGAFRFFAHRAELVAESRPRSGMTVCVGYPSFCARFSHGKSPVSMLKQLVPVSFSRGFDPPN
jgi:hypothetical protein